MKTINEIYNILGQSIINNAPLGWSQALLNIEVLPNFSSYNGIYLTSKGEQNISVFNFPVETGDYLRDLNMITTEGGHNKWNKAKFVVTPDKKFNMEFIWDQKLQNEIDRKNREEEKKDPNYTSPKWHWEK